MLAIDRPHATYVRDTCFKATLQFIGIVDIGLGETVYMTASVGINASHRSAELTLVAEVAAAYLTILADETMS